jgi:hypothetical protein
MNGWESFAMAQVGASAALTGLIFVAVSLNLSKILAYPSLPSMALNAFMMLITVLIISSLLLVPGQSHILLASEILAIAAILWILIVRAQILIWRKTDKPYRSGALFQGITSQCAILPYFVAGFTMLFAGDGGWYWLIPAILITYIAVLSNAWVLLVEINR